MGWSQLPNTLKFSIRKSHQKTCQGNIAAMSNLLRSHVFGGRKVQQNFGSTMPGTFPSFCSPKESENQKWKRKTTKLELHWDLGILMEFQTPGRHRAFCTSPHRALAAAKTVVSTSRMSRFSSVCWCNWGAPEAESDESDESPGATAGATDFLWVNHSADVWDQKLLGLRTIPFGGGLFAGIAICISLSLTCIYIYIFIHIHIYI